MELPLDEQVGAFGLLLALLAVADARGRQTRCGEDCGHWWHQDLRDTEVVQDMRTWHQRR